MNMIHRIARIDTPVSTTRAAAPAGAAPIRKGVRSHQFGAADAPYYLIQRLLAKVTLEPNSGCWLWTGALDNGGYGKISVRNTLIGAHRVAYEMFIGAIPDGLELDHLCRVRCCVNPRHLEPVTSAENVRRGASPAASAARRNHCSKGHPYTPENLIIDSRGGRRCRVCKRESDRRRRAAR